ncbi:MAG: aminotransferase class V-fold PLP-dependent enzyme [Cyclobacteriaceae bacterium]|nr:aminotransferase class V-fold PLP-dependent enzyme [Cyclobacteriaceae bacterium]
MDCQKDKFSLEAGVHYLNCAYMSPLMKQVEEAGFQGISAKATPYKVTAQDFFTESEALRTEFNTLINGGDPQRVAIIPSVSYGMANVARNINLKSGEKIIVAGEQFPSNYYVWSRLARDNGASFVVVEPPDSANRGKDWNEAILRQIDDSTRVVALSHVHWTDGTRFDLEAIRKKTRKLGALLVIDGTQSVGALPFDVNVIQPDALICAGYKWLMGPYAIGLAWYGPAFDDGIPVEENWINRRESQDFAGLVNYRDEYQPGAMRYDVGEHSNFILVPMMLSALKQLNAWGVENIHAYCQKITGDSLHVLRDAGYKIEKPEYRGAHLFGIRYKGIDAASFSKMLLDNNIYVSVRGDAIRVSVNVFNSEEDIQKFTEVCLLAVRK